MPLNGFTGNLSSDFIWDNWVYTTRTATTGGSTLLGGLQVLTNPAVSADTAFIVDTKSNWVFGNGTFELSIPATNFQNFWANNVAVYTTPNMFVQMAEATPEQVAARRTREREYEERRVVAERERVEADARAEALLMENLNAAQQAEYVAGQRFHVRSSKGKLYRINRGISGNVVGIERNPVDGYLEVESHCIHPRVDVPVADVMLAQKLLLETDEPTFRKISNITKFYQPRPVTVPVAA